MATMAQEWSGSFMYIALIVSAIVLGLNFGI